MRTHKQPIKFYRAFYDEIDMNTGEVRKDILLLNDNNLDIAMKLYDCRLIEEISKAEYDKSRQRLTGGDKNEIRIYNDMRQ